MRAESLLNRWIGAALLLVGAVATIWLAAIRKLNFYIHPRYTLFTVTMAAVAAALVVAALIVVPRSGESADHDQHELDEHGHDRHSHDHGTTQPARRRLLTTLRGVVLVSAMLALLVVPPATLSARTRLDRDLVTSDQTSESETTVLAGGNPATFTVKDWASVLRTGGSDAVLGQQVKASGYVLDRGEDDVFYLVRMMITCCAVDSQPVGVPVYRPGWRKELPASTWVAVDGTFGDNPDRDSRTGTVIKPEGLTRIAEPAQPYVF